MMSDQKAKGILGGIAGLRARLADSHPKFAAAEAFERDMEAALTCLRGNLKATRKRLGVEQSELAKRMQVGQPMISRIETGTGDIGLKTLYRYADALGLTLAVDIKAKAASHAVLPREPAAIAHSEKPDEVRDWIAEGSTMDAVVNNVLKMNLDTATMDAVVKKALENVYKVRGLLTEQLAVTDETRETLLTANELLDRTA